MKKIKVNKSLLKLDPLSLLKKLGLIDRKQTQAFPERLYLSKEDSKVLKKNLEQQIKKQYPGINSKKIAVAVGLEWLNFGPNESLSDVIRPGYALIGE